MAEIQNRSRHKHLPQRLLSGHVHFTAWGAPAVAEGLARFTNRWHLEQHMPPTRPATRSRDCKQLAGERLGLQPLGLFACTAAREELWASCSTSGAINVCSVCPPKGLGALVAQGVVWGLVQKCRGYWSMTPVTLLIPILGRKREKEKKSCALLHISILLAPKGTEIREQC